MKGARAAIQRRAAEAGVTGLISGHSLRVGSRGVACRRRGKRERGTKGRALAGSGDAGAVCAGGTGGGECGTEV